MKYLIHGTELELNDDSRGLGEPSLTKFNGEYFMTIRNDNRGFVARSRDGLQFDKYLPWTFNDGTELGSYNTQQHWVTHSVVYSSSIHAGEQTTTTYFVTVPRYSWLRLILKNFVSFVKQSRS